MAGQGAVSRTPQADDARAKVCRTPSMTPSALKSLLRSMAGRRVVCLGDLILDRFIYGAANRVSREAPVVSLTQARYDTMLGGAGNAARNVAALGGTPVFVAPVGEDAEGHEAARLMAQLAGEDAPVPIMGGVTAVKTRYVASGQQTFSVDRDPPGPIDAAAEDALIAVFTEALDGADMAIVSDYGRGAMTPRVLAAAIAAANAAGVRVCVDPRGRDFSRYDGAFLIKPNAEELAEEAGLPVKSEAQASAALTKVMGDLDAVAHLIVTRGGSGMMRLTRGAPIALHPSEPRDVYDVSGAGDTTMAALALALSAGAAMEDAIALANRAGGIVVTKVGTAVVRPEEIIADAAGAGQGGVINRETVADLAARWRADGLTVGLTNGCFDILHVGHLATFTFAKARCDRLIVGVNADASVRRLKGPGRPVNTQDDRAELLAALGPVDAVTIFGEDTASALVETVRPDVYVKGGDYDVETLPETPAVRAVGGTIALAPVKEGRSTTATLAKLQAD